jgi:hypothetical protein
LTFGEFSGAKGQSVLLFNRLDFFSIDCSFVMPVILWGICLHPFFMFLQLMFPSGKNFRLWFILKFVCATQESLIVIAAWLCDSDSKGRLDNFRTGHFRLRALIAQLSAVIPAPSVGIAFDAECHRVVWSCTKPTYDFFFEVENFFRSAERLELFECKA